VSTIALGQRVDEKIMLPKKARDTHMHVIGASGTGKSYFLEHLIRRDITRGSGVCFIDPHGETYNNIVAWLATSGIRTKEIHLIDLSDSKHSVGFNPLCAGEADPSRRVSDMINAFVRVWGGSNINETPRLKKCLRLTLYPLAVHRLSLLEANLFTSHQNKELRRPFIESLPSVDYRNEWEEFDSYSPKEFREYFESTRSRIFEFVTSPSIRNIIGQTDNVLDFKQCMEDGHVVLINLAESAKVHKQEAQVLGAMLIADLYSSAKQRDPATAKHNPFYAYIDECGDYINEDIAKSLDETRKYGLHFILSHQRLQQLRNVSDDTYDAVMANAQTKVVFRVDEDDNAEVLCRHLFRSGFDLEKPKEILNKPVAIGQEIIELFSKSKTTGFTSSESVSETSGSGSSDAESMFMPIDGGDVGHTEISGSSANYGSGSSRSSSEINTSTEGSSQSLSTIYEIMPTAVYSLEEIIHLGIVAIREMPDRTAIVKIGKEKPVRITTFDIQNRMPMQVQVNRFRNRLQRKSRYTHAQRKIERAISARSKELFDGIDILDDSYDPDSFME